jgi:shikimate dehydrogenase
VSETQASSLNAATRYCAVYGHPIKHSASPAMQNAGLAALGLNWRYLAFDVPPDRLRDALLGAKMMGFLGLNLTVPHKLLALDLVDELDDSARIWGAVNTVRFEGQDPQGQWKPLRDWPETSNVPLRSHGFNTDADAIARALREDLGLELPGSRVLLLGAGGAGRTAALKLASEKVHTLYLVNRTAAKAFAAAEEIQARFPGVRVVLGYPEANEKVDLVLNATSVGLKPEDGSPLDSARFALSRAGAVYDMIYQPAETALLQAAQTAGCRVANGLGMLLYQGAAALQLWTGQNPPIEVMREALHKHVTHL